jgi:hypothetical protein
MRTVEEQLTNSISFTKVGDHEIVSLDSVGNGAARVACRICRKQFERNDAMTQRVLSTDCLSATVKVLDDEPEPIVQPRLDYVTIRERVKESRRGIRLPENSLEGREFFVEGVGPDAKDLEIGDQVLMTGKCGTDWSYVPHCHKLIVIREGNIVVKLRFGGKDSTQSSGSEES